MERQEEGEEQEEQEKEDQEQGPKEKEGQNEKEEKEQEKEVQEEKEVAAPGEATGARPGSPDGPRSVLDLLNYFLCPERLTADNRYFCEPCASLQDAERAVELSRGPHYLILTLLRFAFDLRTRRRRKILDDVSLPLLLRLPLAGGDARAYDLCSVVVHSGLSSESGHYYCYARDGAPRPAPQWYLFNDTRVSFSSFESVSNVTSFFPKDTAYVLFYRQRPPPDSDGDCEAEGPGPGTPRARAEPALHRDLMEAISRDNALYLQVSVGLEGPETLGSPRDSVCPKGCHWQGVGGEGRRDRGVQREMGER